MVEVSTIAERVYSIYKNIIDEEFVAQYKGLYSVEKLGGDQPQKRPVYAIESDEFERKLDDIVKAVKEINDEVKRSQMQEPVWMGITGPSSNSSSYWTRYWIWGSEKSTQDGSQYGQTTYQIKNIKVVPFVGSIHTFMVELDVLIVQ